MSMSKQKEPSVIKNVEVMWALDHTDINNLIGKMLTVVDASISDSEQRKALKDIVKQNVWSWADKVPMRVEKEYAKYIAEFYSGFPASTSFSAQSSD